MFGKDLFSLSLLCVCTFLMYMKKPVSYAHQPTLPHPSISSLCPDEHHLYVWMQTRMYTFHHQQQKHIIYRSRSSSWSSAVAVMSSHHFSHSPPHTHTHTALKHVDLIRKHYYKMYLIILFQMPPSDDDFIQVLTKSFNQNDQTRGSQSNEHKYCTTELTRSLYTLCQTLLYCKFQLGKVTTCSEYKGFINKIDMNDKNECVA